MNWFIKLILLFTGTMQEPKAFGWFHILTLSIALLLVVTVYLLRNKFTNKHLNLLLAVYGFGSLLLEIIKQLTWSCNYDAMTNLATWDYPWYIFPFQLCSTPMYVALLCLFLKNGKIKDALYSYLAFVTILGSLAVVFIPGDCFVPDIWVNIQTTWLHYGSLAISLILVIINKVKLNFTSYKQAILTALIFITIANTMNIVVYNSGILNGETFNMFYIGPYFISSLPVFNTIYQNVPYVIFLASYILAIILGSGIIYFLHKQLSKLKRA